MLCSSSLFLLVPKEGFASGLWHFLAIFYMWCPACLFDFVCLVFVVVLFDVGFAVVFVLLLLFHFKATFLNLVWNRFSTCNLRSNNIIMITNNLQP